MTLNKISRFALIFMILGGVIFSASISQTLAQTIVTEIPNPAGENTEEANLYADDNGNVYLTWIKKGEKRVSSLMFSKFEDGDWSSARKIAEGNDWFVNWADFPSLISTPDGKFAAHWLAKSDVGTYAYDVNIARSLDGGKSWSSPLIPHSDGTPTEHGFVSMLPWDEESFFVMWLDGRNFAKDGQASPSNEMTLRHALIGWDGKVKSGNVFDLRICDCCQTSAVRTAHGALIAYRDRSKKEIRDISLIRYSNGKWSEPYTVNEDGWKLLGCPVNGPSLAANGENAALAWFTGAGGTARVNVVFSRDEGASFGKPVIVDNGKPIGRVDILMLQDNSALVSWMENTANGVEIQIRKVYPDGKKDEPVTVSKSKGDRASGFPRMVQSGNKVFITWTETRDSRTIKTAVININ